MRGSSFTFAAGRRAKWIVFAIWFVAIFIAAGPANLPGKFEDAESNEATSYLPGERRIDQGAEGDRIAAERRNRPGGDRLPARVRADRRPTSKTIVEDVEEMTAKRFPGVVADGATAAAGGKEPRPPGAGKVRRTAAAARRRRSPASPPTTRPSSARSARPTARRRSSPPTSRANGEGERILDPVKYWREEISDPRRRARGEDHRRRRLLGRRDRSLRRHQRHPAAGRGQPRDLPADRHLPLADVLLHPAGGGALRRDALALDRLRGLRARGDDQRPVELDHVGARARRRHRLRAAARRPLPRGAAPHRRQARGDADGAAPRPARRSSPRRRR